MLKIRSDDPTNARKHLLSMMHSTLPSIHTRFLPFVGPKVISNGWQTGCQYVIFRNVQAPYLSCKASWGTQYDNCSNLGLLNSQKIVFLRNKYSAENSDFTLIIVCFDCVLSLQLRSFWCLIVCLG